MIPMSLKPLISARKESSGVRDMIESYLAAAISLAMITGVALGQSRTPATTSRASLVQGNGLVGQFWTSLATEVPTRNDDVPKTVELAPPASETASR
jgi:hypothetical protein